MNKLLLKFDDFIDKIEAKVKPPIHRALVFLLIPKNGFDFAIRWFVLLFAIVGIYLLTYIPILKDFSNKKIIGTISSLQVGVTGSGNIRFSGNSEFYYFKINDYAATFYINNMGSMLLGNGSLSRWMFKKGNRIETTITEKDYKRLNIVTPKSSVKGRIFPDKENCIHVYGITINNEKVNSKYDSLLSDSYFNNFGWLIPLYVYFIALSVSFCFAIRSEIIDRKRRKLKIT